MQVGEILRDKYHIVASIGRGGMGEVFHAIHLASGTNVAIKVVHRVVIGEMMMARFEREAEAVARIQSDFIPRLLEVDRTENGELFLVMELLEGETLSERLKKCGGSLPWEEVRLLGDDVLCGLMDAHAAGVIHRDLKPGNIFLEHLPDGGRRARILDFGVCKLDAGDAERLTTTGESVGTIAYMAPEQIRGASQVDQRADLYSFAMVMFEALAGRLAYDASGQMAMLASKLERPARNLNSVVKVPIPKELDALVARCLARDPNERFPNAMELMKAWGSLGPPTQYPAELPVLSAGSIHVPSRPTLHTSTNTLETASAMPHKTSRGLLMIAGGTVLVGGGLILAGLLARHAKASQAADEELQKALESSSAMVTEAQAAQPELPMEVRLGPAVVVSAAPPAIVSAAPVPVVPPAVETPAVDVKPNATKPADVQPDAKPEVKPADAKPEVKSGGRPSVASKTVHPAPKRAPDERRAPTEERRVSRPPPAITPTLIETPKY